MKKYFLAFFFVIMLVFGLAFEKAHASFSSSSVVAKPATCINAVAETGEDCDGADLNAKTCAVLGFSGGTLSCNSACVFDTSSCTVPQIDPQSVDSEDVSSLLAAGYLTVPEGINMTSAPSVTVAETITINVSMNGGTSSIELPQNTVITRTDSANLDATVLNAASLATSSVSGFSGGTTVKSVLQWGIANAGLEFSDPINLSIYVGASLNGQTLDVVRSTSTSSGWTSDGIVSPATCLVALGMCSFQVTKASYYAVTTASSSPTPTSVSNSNSTSTTTSSSSSSDNCKELMPGNKAQWLYAAVAQQTSVVLYFTDGEDPVDHYALQFGVASNKYIFGQDNFGKKGVRAYSVQSLMPNTTYYFRVRPGNGCASGPWSNEISVTTKALVAFDQLQIVSSELISKKKQDEITETNIAENKLNQGYVINVKVIDLDKKPVEGASVTIHSVSQQSMTDKNGVAVFKNIEPGEHRVLIAYNNYKGEQAINLNSVASEFDLTIQVKPVGVILDSLLLEIIAIMFLIIVVLLIIIRKLRTKKSETVKVVT